MKTNKRIEISPLSYRQYLQMIENNEPIYLKHEGRDIRVVSIFNTGIGTYLADIEYVPEQSNNEKIRPERLRVMTPRVPNRPKPLDVRLNSYIEGLMDDDGITLENTAEVLVYDVNQMFKPMIALLVSNAYQAYCASLDGSLAGSNSCSKRFNNHKDFNVGDVVMEISTIYNTDCHIDRIGKVLSIFDKDRGYVEIETLDGRSFTWDNASFIKIHTEVRFRQ